MTSHPIADGRNALVAAVQMISGPRVVDNLAVAGRLVAEAAAQGAQLVVLPEYFPIIGLTEGDKIKVREEDALTGSGGVIQSFLAETALKHGIWLIGGSIPLAADTPDKVLNSCVAYSPAGLRVARYDKIHLFGFKKGAERYDEAATIQAGKQLVAFDTSFGRIGLSICYDLRFPELYRALSTAEQPVDLFVVPAAFTETTGRAHWELLLRARAVENQCYVMGCGQGGRHESGRETHGNSMLVDPWGTIVDRKQKGPGLAIGLLNHGYLHEVRESLPALRHRVL